MSEQNVTSMHDAVRRRMAKDLALTIRRAPSIGDATRIAEKVLQRVQDSTCLALIEEFDLYDEVTPEYMEVLARMKEEEQHYDYC